MSIIFSKISLLTQRISPGQAGFQKLKTKIYAVSCLLTLFTALSVAIPAQATQQSTLNSKTLGISSQPVFAVGILDFFKFLDFGSIFSNQAETRHLRPVSLSVESEATVARNSDPPTTATAAPCVSTGVTLNVPGTYSSIQTAINAANPSGGDKIQVAAGTYTEQLTVNKCVTIDGAGQGSTIIKSPAALAASLVPGITNTASIVEVRSNSYVTMSNLTVTGPVPFTNDVYGIYVVENSTFEMDDARVTAIHQSAGIDGVQNGNAVRAGSVSFNQIGSLKFNNATIDDYQKTGIIVSRSGSAAAIDSSSITGAGAQTAIGQNGIQISDGATATITNNTIGGNVCDNTACSFSTYYSYGVIAYQSGALTISGNTFNNNDAGVYSWTPGFTSTITGNTLTQTRYSGLDLDQGTVNVNNNFIKGSAFGPVTGVGVLSYTGDTGNTVASLHSNSITGASQAGIELDDFDTGDAFFPTLTADFNRIAGNAKGIDNNTTSSTVSQTNNFWGCNQGSAGGAGCDTTEGLVNTSNPYLILSNTTTSTPSVNAGGTATITTNLRFNNLGTDTYTVNNHLPNPIASTPTSANSPNGIPVGFSVNNPAYGSISPTTAPLFNGLASTTFTGGTVNGGDKIAVVTAQVDNATNSVNVTVLDTIAPTVLSAVGSQGSPTVVNYTVTFSETVTGVDASDFNLVSVSGNVVASITGVSCTGAVCTVQITVASGMGTIRLDVVDDDTIVDTAGTPNKLGGTGAGNGNFTGGTFAVDVQMPTVTINQKTSAPAQSDPTSTAPINFTVVFSEPVTGFATGDVTVSGTAFGVGSNPSAVVTGSGTTYNVAVSGMNQSGTVVATIAAGVAVDNVGNPNAASTSTDNTVTFNLVNTAVTVNPTNTNTAGITMWSGFNDVTNALTPPSYFVGPMTPPLGTGSARLNTTATGKYLFFSTAFNSAAALPLSQITELSYSSYAVDPSNALNLPSLQIGIDYDSTDANTGFQGRLVFEPANNTTAPNQMPAQNQWQTWNAVNGNFWFTSAPGNVACGQATPCSLATILATYPTINVPNTAFGFIGFRSTGGGTNAVENYVDNFMIGVNSANTTFNFEAQPPTISIGDATVTEGNSGTTAATFTITQSVVSQLATTVTVNTADGTATTANNDYAALVNQTATIAAGQTTTTVTVNVNGDLVFEPNETFTVNLSNAVNAAINDGQGLGTINNDDAVPTVTINQASGQADPTNVSPINFTVVFNTPVTGFATGDVSFAGSTAGGTLVGTVTGSGTTYNVAVTGMTSSGLVVASIPAGVANDGAGNPNAASTSSDNSVTYFTTTAAMIVDDDGQADLGPGGTPNCNATTPAPNKIQTAINLSSPGDTILVCPGTYVEELTVNKQLTILGPNAGVNPNTGTRTAEAIINPTTSDASFSGPVLVTLATQNITFNGFTLDGDNPLLTGGTNFNGANVDAGIGIDMPDLNNPQETVTNNIVKNIGELGMEILGNNAGGNANSTVQNNKFDNIPGVTYGGGIYLGNNGYANVTGNVLTRVSLGIVSENFSQAGAAAASVSNNQVTANRIGIRHNLHYTYTTPGFTISNNTINSYIEASDPGATRFSGIRIESIQGTVTATFSGNTITPNRSALQAAGYTRIDGIFLTNTSTVSPNIAITGNTITNALRGISHNVPAVPTVTCNSIFNNDVGVYVGHDIQFGNTSESYATGGIIIGGTNNFGNNIVGNTTFGVQVDQTTGLPPDTGSSTVAPATASYNYWGAANGPGPVGPGSGDKVTTNVTFTPFSTVPNNCAPVSPPTVTINQASGQNDPTNTQPINFTVVFSEAVTGFTNSDVILSGTAGNIGGATIIVTGSGTTYNVAVSGLTTDGTVIANIPVAAAQSVATGSPTSASTSSDNTATLDTLAPTVMINQAAGQADPTNASPINFTVVFSEVTTNFATGDVTLSGTAGATTATVTGSGTTYNVAVTGMTSSGTVIATIGAGVATDAAGNGNAASTSIDNTVTYDITAPTVTINQASGQADPTGTSPINFTVVFSEPVTGFATGDVTVSGTAFGVGSNPSAVVTGSGTTYNVAVSGMNQSGTVVATIAAGVAVDNVGNPNAASTSTDNTVTFNLVNTAVTVNPTNTNTAGPTMWFGFNDVTDTVIQPSYVVGPTGQPLGVGSSRIRTSDTGKYLFANNTTYAGTRLDQITELSYSEYANNPGNTAKAPSLQLGFDFNLDDASEAFNGRLVFEPYQNTTAPNQPLVQGTWQRWNATNGLFYTSSSTLNGNPTPCPQAAPCTRAQLLAAFPNAGIHRGALGLIGFRGEGSGGGVGFEGNVDAFTVGVSSSNTTFNFEPTPPTISIGNAAVTEGNSGTTTATFTITQSVVSQLDTTVTINTANGTATTADNDYQPIVNGTATIPAGQTSTTVTVNVNGDTNVEGNETFTVNLSNAVNAAIATGTGTGTINNDDVVISFSSPTYSVGEAGGTATITVTRNGVTPNPVSVNYATGSGTATGGAACTTGVDFINTSGTLTFAGGDTSKTFTVTICDDLISEAGDPETVNLTLSGVTGGATLGTAAAVLNIFDNDGAGVVTIAGNIKMYNAPAANTNLQGVTVTLSGSASQTTTTDSNGNYSFTGLTAGGSYQVTPSGLGKIYDPIYRNYSSLNVNVTNADFLAYNSINDVPRKVRVGFSTVLPGQQVSVPIKLESLGDENGVSFSLTYDTARLSNPVVTLGADAAGGSVIANTGTPGVVGVVVAKPSGQTFGAAGTKEIVKIQFNTTATTNPNTPLTFANSPVVRNVNDANANPRQSQFINGFVVFSQGLEADVEPSPNGDGDVDLGDFNQIGQYAANLASPGFMTSNEFQRADCEPTATKGDADVDLGDFIQAGRYAAFLDPVQSVGGPAYPNPLPPGFKPIFDTGKSSAVPRIVSAANVNGSPGNTVTVAVQIDAESADKGVSFTMDYDASKLSNPQVSLGSGGSGGFLVPNTNMSGKVIVQLAYITGGFQAGVSQIILIQFTVANNAPAGITPLTFNDTPVQRQVRDTNNTLVTSTFTNGSVNILGATAANVFVNGKVQNNKGRGVANAQITMIDSRGEMRVARSNSFGNFRFADVPSGETYTISVSSKQYKFATRVMNISQNLDNLVFTAEQ